MSIRRRRARRRLTFGKALREDVPGRDVLAVWLLACLVGLRELLQVDGIVPVVGSFDGRLVLYAEACRLSHTYAIMSVPLLDGQTGLKTERRRTYQSSCLGEKRAK